MTDRHLVISKHIRDGFTASLHYELNIDQHDNPRCDRDNIARIHLWEDINHTSDSDEIKNYTDSLHHLYQNIYPELIDYLQNDEPPLEIFELLEATQYPGAIKWILVRDHQEISITTTDAPDVDDRYLSGVAFIPDQQLDEEKLTREEGVAVIENDLVLIQEYLNGNIFRLTVDIDGEEQCYGTIYALENYQTIGRLSLHRSCHIPLETELDDILMDFAQDDHDRALIRSTTWN